MVPKAGIEPASSRASDGRSTLELLGLWYTDKDLNLDLPLIGRAPCHWTIGAWHPRWDLNPERDVRSVA